MDNKEIILNAIDNGFYYKNKNEVYYTPYAVYVGKTYNGSFILTRNTNDSNERSFDWDKDLNFYIKDYGKTWALTEEELENKSKVWKPKKNEKYWYISEDYGAPANAAWLDNDYCEPVYTMGNCFKTREECEFAIERLKVIKELERFAEENNGEMDWNDIEISKWHLFYKYKEEIIDINDTYTWKYNDIYFSSEEIARKAIETIGEERIKKYYLKVEE